MCSLINKNMQVCINYIENKTFLPLWNKRFSLLLVLSAVACRLSKKLKLSFYTVNFKVTVTIEGNASKRMKMTTYDMTSNAAVQLCRKNDLLLILKRFQIGKSR